MLDLRTRLLAQLRARRFDLLVVGGGIVGAGIVRDAAMRGLRVALIEQRDFASGTSSKTSKLIHGGLRYLEQGRLRLVCESLRERQILRTIAPEFIHPLSILIPVYRGQGQPGWKIHAGLWLYDLLARGRTIHPHRMVSARRATALEPGLRVDGLRMAGVYADCQMDDARVCLSNILQAVGFGAVCGNYLRLAEFLKADDGRLCGGVVEDQFTGSASEIQAEVVVNATGPWSDDVRRLCDRSADRRLAPTKGIHLILPRVAQEALFVPAQADGRMVFVLPWGNDYSLVGTTDTALEGSVDELRATPDDVGYLLEEVNRVLPGSHVDEEDVIATYAGARPLMAFAGSSTRASREHRIEVDASGLISVLGGKFTTYRLMAKQAVDLVAARLRRQTERSLTDQVRLLETVHPVALDHWQQVAASVDPDLLARLLTRYGAGGFQILRLLAQEPALAQPVCPHHEYINAELVHALQQELACTVTDVLARRTRIAWSSCQGLDFLSTVKDLWGRYGGFALHRIEQQLEEYGHFLAAGLAFRPSSQGRLKPADRQGVG